MTYASQSIDVKRGAEWQPLSELDKVIQSEYDPEFCDGAPISARGREAAGDGGGGVECIEGSGASHVESLVEQGQ